MTRVSTPAGLVATLGLQSLLQEPERLANEADRCNVELESLVLENYRVFVENLTCSLHLQNEEKRLDETWKSLYAHISDLSRDCSAFKEQVQAFVTFHKRNRKTLQHHMQLLELLEVPQLVDACIRTGLLDEALELALFVNNLERRHLLAHEVKAGPSDAFPSSSSAGPRRGADVIQRIVGDVHALLGQLQQSLLLQLTEATALPRLILILATLRKMDSLFIDRLLSLQRFQGNQGVGAGLVTRSGSSGPEALRQSYVQACETKHQMDFLEARSVYLLRQQASSAPALSHDGGQGLGAYGRAMELLEQRRGGLFNVIAHFQALFLDAPHSTSGSGGGLADTGVAFSGSTVLHTWCVAQVRALLVDLRELLAQIDDGSALRSIAEQALYLSQRLAQVSCDLTPLVLALFEDVLVQRLQRDARQLLQHFSAICASERVRFHDADRDQIIPVFMTQDTPAGALSTAGSGAALVGVGAGEEVDAPGQLLRLPPLAFALNALLQMVTLLRDVPLRSLQPQATSIFGECLHGLAGCIDAQRDQLRRLGDKYFAEGHSEAIERLYASALAQDLAPHVLACLQSVFDQRALEVYLQWRATRGQQGGGQHVAVDADALRAALGRETADQTLGLWRRLAGCGLLDERLLASKQTAALHTVQAALSASMAAATATATVPVPAVIATAAAVVDAPENVAVDTADNLPDPAPAPSSDA